MKFADIQVNDRLRVRLGYKLSLVPAYFCEGVTLHNAKAPNGAVLIMNPAEVRDD